MGKNGFRAGALSVKKLTVSGKMPVEIVIPKTVIYASGALITGWNTATGTAAKTAVHLVAQPPFACAIGVQPNAAGTAAHADGIKVKGYLASGKYVEEVIPVAGTAATRTWSNNAFAKIVSLKPYPSYSPTPKSTSVSMGFRAKVIGLPYPIAASTDLLTCEYDGAYATAAPTISAVYNTLTLATVADAKTLRVAYLSKVQ